MARSDLPFPGPLKEHDFLERSPRTQPPGGSRSQGGLRLASWALAGGVLFASLTGSASASELRPVVRKESSQRSSVHLDADRGTATQNLAQEWEIYLQSLRNGDAIEPQLAVVVQTFWSRLTSALEQRPEPPVAGPTEQATFIVVWDHARHHFEVEFFPGDTAEWFYRDRQTESFEDGEGNLELAVEAAQGYFNRVRVA